MYRLVDALVVRAAACGVDVQRCGWPDLTGQGVGVASWRVWLQDIVSAPEFVVALEHASPVLADRVHAICEGRTVSDRDARRVVLSVMRYVLRAGGRATPYGLFAGVAPAHVAGVGAVRLGTAHRAVARISAEWVATVVDRLEADRHLRPHLMVRANNLLVQRGGKVVLAHRASGTPGGAPLHVSVRATAPVRAALALAADPIRVAHLAERLAADFGVDADRAEVLLADMIAQRLLLTNLRPAKTATKPLVTVVTALEAALRTSTASPVARDGLSDARQILAGLRESSDRAARHDRSLDWAVAGARRRELAASLAAVCPTPRSAVAVDLRLNCDLVVPSVVTAEAARAAGVLARLAQPASVGWVAWHRRFLERYGPHALVPVLDAVDADIGLGYPAGFQGGPPVPPPAWTDRDRTLLALAQNAALRHQREIVLDEPTITGLASDDPMRPIQPSTALTVRVHAPTLDAVHRGEFRLALVGVSHTAGSTTGRFLDLFGPGDRDRIAAQYAAVPTAIRGAVVAQIAAATPYTATEDVARVPQVIEYLIPLGEYHGHGAGTIGVTDLAVTADAYRLYLVWLSRRCPVEPVVLNAVEPVHHTLPIVRFLTEVTTALGTPCTTFDWGGAASLPFLPALRYERTILSPARWRLLARELPGLAASWSDWSRALSCWRDAVGCPPAVHLGDGDQRIGLDLAEPAHRALLRDNLSRSGAATLRATPAADSAGWIGGRAHEIVIPLAATIEPAPPPRLSQRTQAVVVREHGVLPGYGGRFYVKVYGHPDRQTTILTHHLPSLIDALGAKGRWWFFRYQDPEPHLRLRVKPAAKDGVTVIGEWARQLRHAGLTARVQFDTDFPETSRFGGTGALTAAEAYFAADSEAALAQFTATDHTGTVDLRALTAASLLDLTTAFIGDTGQALRWLIDHARLHRPAPPRAVYDQAILLANPHSTAQLTAIPGGDRVVSCWYHRRRALHTYRDALAAEGATSPAQLLPDLLHLHHTRVTGPDPDGERTCLHLARAAALSWTTRGRSQP